MTVLKLERFERQLRGISLKCSIPSTCLPGLRRAELLGLKWSDVNFKAGTIVIERQIQRDLEDGIRAGEANTITVNALFKSFMDLRTDLKETTRCNYICLYDKQVRDELGGRKIRSVKFSDIQRLYMHMVQDLGLKASTVQSVHSILYQMFESAVMDNLIRVNPAANVLKSLRKMLLVEQEKRHALTEEEQAKLIEYVYQSRIYCRLGTLFTVLLGTGMRIGEALHVSPDTVKYWQRDKSSGLILEPQSF